jgi:hypothetical protein
MQFLMIGSSEILDNGDRYNPGLHLNPYIRLGPRCGCESVDLTASVIGGRGIWQEKAEGRKRSKRLTLRARGNAPARARARRVGRFCELPKMHLPLTGCRTDR